MTSPRSSSSPLATSPAGTRAVALPGGAQAVFAGRAAGDFSQPGSDAVAVARSQLAPVPWTWLKQVHGAGVIVVDHPGARCGDEADAAIGARPGLALAVLTADCAPVALSSPQGVAAMVHAGWRGLMAGVVGATVKMMRQLGATDVLAALGPCIRPHAYRFSASDMAAVVARFGPSVRSVDQDGYVALDLPAAVRAALADDGVGFLGDTGVCTHCSPEHWSWRARQESGRQANLVLTSTPAAA